MAKSLVIGIAGGTGSGKTTLTERIVEAFGDDVSVIYHDNYYKQHDELPYEERCRLNYDHPDAFDTELFINDLEKLKNGEEAVCPVYDFTVHNRSSLVKTVKPSKVIIVEGILILSDARLASLLDIKIFVDTDADVRVLRRIARDVRTRGRSIDSVIEQYLTTVKPMHDKYVEPSKHLADIIVLEGGRNAVALDLIMSKIKAYLERQ